MERTVFLERYINSLGNEIPADYEDYQSGNSMGKYCPLCSEYHDRLPFMQYFPYDVPFRERLVKQVHLCSSCTAIIEKNLLPVLFNLVEDPTFEKTALKIQTFNNGSRFGSDVASYLSHLDIVTDTYAKIPLKRCYFCETILAGEKTSFVLRVPMDAETTIVEGSIYVCKKHYQMLDLTVQNNYYLTNCVECKKEYFITASEYDARVMSGSVTQQHYCGQCAYHKINELVPYDPLYLQENAGPIRETPMRRFLSKVCFACQQTFFLDLTIDHDLIRKTFFHLQECLCSKCNKLRDRQLMEFDSQTLLAFKQEKEGWRYEIWRRHAVGKIKLALVSDFTDTSLTNLVQIAFHETLKSLLSKQLELWNDEP